MSSVSESYDADVDGYQGASKRNIAALKARRRANTSDEWISSHDHVDEEGRKVRAITKPGPEGTEKTYHVDYSAMLATTPSTTTNTEIIRIEAEQAAEGREDMNPHLPANDEVLAEALTILEREGLLPAWEVVDE